MRERTVAPRKQINPPENLHDLRKHLCEMYADVSNDRAMVPQADAAANVAGKIINITKLELEAARMAGKDLGALPKQFLLGEKEGK
jgi:hypothetical protein